MSLVYGKETPTRYSDPEIIAVQKVNMKFMDCLRPGNFLVDRFRFLKYLPIPEVRTLRRYYQEQMDLYRRQLDAVRQHIVSLCCIFRAPPDLFVG